MPSSDEPDAPTIQDIKDQIQKKIAAVQKKIDDADVALAKLEAARADLAVDDAQLLAAAAKAKNDAEIRRLAAKQEADVAKHKKDRQPLIASKKAQEAQKKALEDQEAALDRQLTDTDE